jgi:D-beta-D-heptose 7-phosphate kinase / D-beta-D-heptose 1-phosphate adenosyltransferase
LRRADEIAKEAGMTDLARAIDALPAALTLCLGDVMLDRFVYGSVDRISPEAPIPVLRIDEERRMLGGAGNVAANLAALGAGCRFVSAIGDDVPGGLVQGQIAELTGAADGLIVEAGRRTTEKTRFIAARQQLLRTDHEVVAPPAPATQAAMLAAAEQALATAGAVILSDYGKGVLTDDLLTAVINAARKAGKPVVVDPKGADYRKYRGASVLTPNRKELALATGLPTSSDEQVVAACRKLIETCGVEAVAATRSEEGMTIVAADGSVAHLRAKAREVYDVSGAGDTVVATLTAALAVGVPLVEAAHLANLAAGVVVAKVGTAVVRLHELHAAQHAEEWRSGEEKVLSLEDAAEWAARKRAQGRRVGFTNGCFDLLHPGHISLLTQARNACDALIVGLNSDASVKRLKGETRPVQSESARATVLASLSMADLVVVFGEDTPEKLIRALRPDVLIKGADYTIDKVVGADFVQSYGGKVVLADLVAGQSTTSTIARMGK